MNKSATAVAIERDLVVIVGMWLLMDSHYSDAGRWLAVAVLFRRRITLRPSSEPNPAIAADCSCLRESKRFLPPGRKSPYPGCRLRRSWGYSHGSNATLTFAARARRCEGPQSRSESDRGTAGKALQDVRPRVRYSSSWTFQRRSAWPRAIEPSDRFSPWIGKFGLESSSKESLGASFRSDAA